MDKQEAIKQVTARFAKEIIDILGKYPPPLSNIMAEAAKCRAIAEVHAIRAHREIRQSDKKLPESPGE